MKKKIDTYFSENYDLLTEAAQRNVDYYKRAYDFADVISYAYEYCLKKSDSLDLDNIDNIVHRVIITSCYWEDSPLNREMLLKQTPFEGTADFEAKPVEKDGSDLNDKILLEKWFNDKQSILAMYRERIKVDKPKLIILDKMIEFKTTNSRKLGKHFGIHYLSAYAYIREIQEEIRDFEEEVNNYDLKSNLTR